MPPSGSTPSPRRPSFLRKWFRRFVKLSILGLLLLLFPFDYISLTTWSDRTGNPDELGDRIHLVVLGTSKYMRDGSINDFYLQRILGAVRLYENGKVESIVVSGHGQDLYYNEPQQMKKDLIEQGVPADLIEKDPDGLRTILSVQAIADRGGENIVFVSQRFHNERAIFLARRAGVSTQGFDVPNPRLLFLARMWVREIFARHLAMWESF